MKPKNKYTRGCPDALGANCVTWDGPDIPAIGIYNGDTNLADGILSIAEKICDIETELDLSTLDLSCIIDLCAECQEQKNLKTILQLLLDNNCKLQDLINNLNNSDSSSGVILNLNLKCLKKYDEFDNEIPQDLNQTLQSLVNQVCSNTSDISIIKGQIGDLQEQIDGIDLTPVVTESIVTTCVSGAKPTSQALVAVANDYCNFKSTVGDVLDVQKSIGNQCEDLNQSLGAVEGWNINPQNLAQSFGNLWIAYCNLLSRVTLIENNCCKVTCKDIIVGMIIIPNESGDGISVKFSTSMGTYIPEGFIDNGSVLTIIDKNGKKLDYPIIVSQDGTQGEFSFVGLDTSAPLTASVNAKLQSDSLGCEKCVGVEFEPMSGCPVCEITAVGDKNSTGSVTIIYEV